MATTQTPAAGSNLNGRTLAALRDFGSVEILGTGGVLGSAERANAKSAAHRAGRILGVRVETVLTLHGLLVSVR